MLQFAADDRLVDPTTRRSVFVDSLEPPRPTPTQLRRGPAIPAEPMLRNPPRLPQELIELIVNHLDTLRWDEVDQVWTEDPEEEPWRELYACALTSKAFLGPARTRLYHKVTISVESPLAPGWQLVLPDDYDFSTVPEELLYTTAPKQLECTLVFCPHLARLVRRLDLVFRDLRNRTCILDTPAKVLGMLLDVCLNVRHVAVRSSSIGDPYHLPFAIILESREAVRIIGTIVSSPAKLESLSLSGMDLEDEVPCLGPMLLRLQPTLTKLRLGPKTSWNAASFIDARLDADVDSEEVVPFPLKSFETSHPGDAAFGPRGLLTSSHDSLTTLSLAFDALHSLALIDFTLFPALKSLTWTAGMAPDPKSVQRIQDLTRPLALHSLAIRHPSPSLEFGSSFDWLPSTLKSLELPNVAIVPFLAFLGSSACPDLRALQIRNLTSTVEDDIENPRLGDGRRRVNEMEIKAIWAACGVRGFALYHEGVKQVEEEAAVTVVPMDGGDS